MNKTAIIIFISSLLYFLQASAVSNMASLTNADLPIKVELTAHQKYYLMYDQDGNLIIQLADNHKYITVNSSFVDKLSDRLEDIAKSACKLKIRPDTVTVSIMFLSVTWNTEKLCKAQNK